MGAQRKKGSIVYNRLRSTWNYLYTVNGQRKSRKIATLAECPTRAEAERNAEVVRRDVRLLAERAIPTVNQLIEQYRVEKMPKRYSTRRGYEVWLRCYIVPRWGNSLITDVRAREVELWLGTLELSPKSKAELRGLLRILWEFAMWPEVVPAQRNPMELIRIKGASKRTRQPRSLSTEEFQQFQKHLEQPFRLIALLCLSVGLRISECLSLRWSDVNWLEGKLLVERSIVRGRVDDTKTTFSNRTMPVDPAILAILQQWKQQTRFSADSDWIFASPAQIGRQPWSYDRVLHVFGDAGEKAGIGRVTTHVMRHSFRSWLDMFGTPLGLQRELLRHADIRTTMRYGQANEPQLAQAHHKVVSAALAKAN